MDIRKFMKRSGDLLAVENKRQRSSSPLDTSRPSTSDADDEASLPRMPSQQYEKDESNSGVINDVAKFAKLRSSLSQGRNLSDEQRVTVLKNLWIPDPNTQFSVPQRFMKRGLKFQFNCLSNTRGWYILRLTKEYSANFALHSLKKVVIAVLNWGNSSSQNLIIGKKPLK